MSAAVLSLIALAVVVGFSLTARINIGILAVALAWPIAVFAAGWKADALMATFPSSLFLTLVGVTLMFGVTQRNGTLEALARRAVPLCGGRPALLPFVFFFLAAAISSLGPGAIAATALIAPLAKGQHVGVLKIHAGDQLLREVPLVALAAVEQAGFFSRAWDAVRLWIK